MKNFLALIGLVMTTTALMAEVKAETLLAVLAKVQKSDQRQALALVQVSAEAPEEYVLQKLKRTQELARVTDKQVRGVLTCARLVALAIEEKPGDIDPLIFVRDGTNFRLLINLTRLRDSGLEKDEQCTKDYEEIDRWIDKLKGR